MPTRRPAAAAAAACALALALPVVPCRGDGEAAELASAAATAESCSWGADQRLKALEARLARLEAENALLQERRPDGFVTSTAVHSSAAVEPGLLRFRPAALEFAMVSDLDKASRDPQQLLWRANVRRGTLHFQPPPPPAHAGAAGARAASDDDSASAAGSWQIRWGATESLHSIIAVKNRSFELSALVRYGGQLLSACDITGLVYEVDLPRRQAFQRWALSDGDGFSTKPFKSEWATVKDGTLIIGSMGREWVAEDGSIEHFNNQWVKTIDANGRVRSANWRPVFEALRSATGNTLPGYLWHEAIEWDARARRWLVLPRKASHEVYAPEADETRGTNLLLVASEDFSTIQVHRLGPLELEWGFSALRKVPGFEGTFLALKVLEVAGRTATRIALFDLGGLGGSPRMLLDPPLQAIGDEAESSAKYEGLEFLSDG